MGGLKSAKPVVPAWSSMLQGASALGFAVAMAHAASAQTQLRPSFKVDVRLVEVDAIVTDADGRPVPDLRKEDFQVFEDGRPQEVATFSLVNLPTQPVEPLPPAASAFETDIATNVRPPSGRLYILFLDDLHTAALRTVVVKAAARGFIERHLGPTDVAAVVQVGGGASAGQGFTSDRRLLLAAIDRFAGRKAPSETINRIEEYNRQLTLSDRNPISKVRDPDAPTRADAARVVLDTLASVARSLAGGTGRRKALLWFGEGVDYDLLAGPAVAGVARPTFGDLARANIAVYGIDARGLRGLGDEYMRIGSVPVNPSLDIGPAELTGELRQEQENLRLVSNQTGGLAVVNTTDFQGAFDRIVKETSTYYMLGYYAAPSGERAVFRRIDVKLTRPGLQVRARQGYIASVDRSERSPGTTPHAEGRDDISAVLQSALASPLPQTALPMAVQAVPGPGPGAKASVLLTVQYAASAFQTAGDEASPGEKLETSVVVVDPIGKIVSGDRTTIPLDVGAESRQAIAALGFRVVSRLELPPGRYELRVATIQTASGKLGSVRCDVEVPDPANAAFVLSPILVTSPLTARIPTAGRDVRLPAALPGPPTTVRAFNGNDVLTAHTEVWDGAPAGSHTVEVVTSVRADGGREVLTGRQERTAGEDGGPSALSFTSRVPLEALPAGVYLLRVEATSRAGTDSQRAVRELPFAVLPEK
jgi:VWFA-related protein